ncbi:MAG: FHA domain-containing protein [Gemmatimonadota bacterium]
MTSLTPTARLVCRTGALAGSTFELAGNTALGVDGAGRPAVGQDADLAAVHARIRHVEGGFVMEEAAGGSAQVDGQPLRSSAALERMHVIEVAGQEFVFSRSMVRRPPDSPPPDTSPPEALADAEHTVVDMMGFGALPDLGPPAPGVEDPAEGNGSAGGANRPEEPDAAAQPSPAAPLGNQHTVVDMAGFGVLPDLGKTPAPPVDHRAPKPAPPGGEDATRVAPAVPAYELVVLLPTGGPLQFPLAPGDNVIGRGSDADIRIEDPDMWLSRKHAIVRVGAHGVQLVDLGARNGTFIGDRRIETAALTPGASFLLGPHLEFRLHQQ